MEIIFSEIFFKNTQVPEKNKISLNKIRHKSFFLLSRILVVLKHEHVSSDFYIIWSRVFTRPMFMEALVAEKFEKCPK